MNYLTTDTSEKARQLVEKYGVKKALLKTNYHLKVIKRFSCIFGKSNYVSNKIGYWQEIKQAIEFKKKEKMEKGKYCKGSYALGTACGKCEKCKGYLKVQAVEEAYKWIAFDFMDLESRPKKCDKYLICRKDGKIHWETWNGTGWAYNHNEIRFWAKITNPINSIPHRHHIDIEDSGTEVN